MTMYQVRLANLRGLIAQWGGPTSLAKKLKHANGSFLSQLAGPSPSREVTERTARKIEKQLSLPSGWLDQDRSKEGEKALKNNAGTVLAQGQGTGMSSSEHSNTPVALNIDYLASCIAAITAACESIRASPGPEKFGDLVSLAYASGLSGEPLQQYAKRLAQLTSS